MHVFWCVWCFVWGAAVWLCAYLFIFRKKGKGRRCSVHTTGTVIRYSTIQYGGESLPVAEYTAGGRRYEVTGPKFRGYIRTTAFTPAGSVAADTDSNLTTREELPLTLKVKTRRNSFGSVYVSPLARLYPVGSSVDIYYNPDRPKEAFVQRFEGVYMWLGVLFGFIGTAVAGLGIFLLFSPGLFS